MDRGSQPLTGLLGTWVGPLLGSLQWGLPGIQTSAEERTGKTRGWPEVACGPELLVLHPTFWKCL